MSTNVQALETLARRQERLHWIKVWYLGLRRDVFGAKRAAANAGWWSDLQDGWAAEEWKLESDSPRTPN